MFSDDETLSSVASLKCAFLTPFSRIRIAVRLTQHQAYPPHLQSMQEHRPTLRHLPLVHASVVQALVIQSAPTVTGHSPQYSCVHSRQMSYVAESAGDSPQFRGAHDRVAFVLRHNDQENVPPTTVISESSIFVG